mgnify:FL=1|jgi:hypothetical protein
MGLDYAKTIEKWDVLEATISGPNEGNPFCDQWIKGTFCCKNEKKTVDGFYDGDGVYKVRFMPSFTDEYTFEIEASFDIKAGAEVPDEGEPEHKHGTADDGTEAEQYAVRNILTGSFTVIPPSADNHGPVRVAGTYYLAYEDGTPYHCIGTTCYVWNLQNGELQKQTLKTLEENAFNKIRFCIFPKHYDYNLHEPITYPYEGTPCDSSVLNENNFAEYNGCAPGNDWDFTRFNPAHFQHIEKCIQALMKLGIEADLIVMHPYDRWGFSMMKAEDDDRYWKYVLARFSAYRNVWWSLANEYDLMHEKTLSDWERYAGIICEKDPYHHLRSIHNCKAYYDYNLPWITHCSIQRTETYRSSELVNEWREKYHKPVILDEICYEGNIQFGWGNISGEEMTRRFWEAFCRGGYPGHGETYLSPDRILWWSHGGVLHGTSPDRIRFLAKIMEETPGLGVEPMPCKWDEVACRAAGFPARKDYFIYYYSFMRPGFRDFYFDDTTEYQVEIIDTWEMTVTDGGIHKGKFRVKLPGKEYMAVRLQIAK